MTTSNESSTIDQLLAGLTLFTRFPFWKIKKIPADAFKRAVEWWPLAGWFTGGTMAISYLIASQLWTAHVALLIPLVVRILITGALHEDGLADVCDGLGGGTTPTRRLEIMKDSHIGTYGVLGLIVYNLLIYCTLLSGYEHIHWMVFLIFDPGCKAISTQLINILPYARPVEQSKIQAVYQRISLISSLRAIFIGLLPLLLWCMWNTTHGIAFSRVLISYALPMCIPIFVLLILTSLFKKKIGGYTGDCCGATFLLLELSAFLSWSAIGNLGFM